jgi:carboxyl-terminal processing protease
MRTSLNRLAIVAALLLMQAGAAPASPEPGSGSDSDLSARIAERFSRRMPTYHLLRLPMDDAVSASAWTNFLRSLDFDHMYFLQSDVAEFAHYQTALDDSVGEGDLTFAEEVFTRFKQRVQERYDYTDQLLTDGFDLQKKESYRWNRREADWPSTTDECNELWRRKIKNEYLRQIVAKQIAEESSEEEDSDGDAPAPTNTLASVSADTPPAGTNSIDETALDETPDLSPEALIRGRYKQMLTMLNDSDGKWLIEKYLTAFAHAYDPHSGYMAASSVEDFDIEMKLSLTGIGALLRAEDGAAKVVRLIPGGPADMDTRDRRLRPGDKIIAVGQDTEPIVDVLHWPLHRIVSLIRGPKGSRVVLSVIPASDPSGSTTKQVDLVRDEVKLEEQAADSSLRTLIDTHGDERTFGVIRLPAFYASMSIDDPRHPEYRSAAKDVQTILHSLQTNGVEGVILDLRNNGGGSLMEAIRMTGLFIRSGPTVQVRERHSIRVLPDRDPRLAYAGPLVVLVNRLSASASEIVAGALQDYGRALVVGGEKTHGKGTVQTIVSLGRDARLGSLRVTTASYYRISGSSTQLRGVAPDILVPSPFDFMKLGEDALPNPIPWSAVMPTRFVPVADLDGIKPQLRAASEARRRKSERFGAYQKLLDRIKAINDAEELPLDLEGRLALARSERDLAELQESLIPEPDSDESDKGEQADLVLEEALQILADFTGTQHATAALRQEENLQDRNPLMRMFDQLLQTP